MIELSRATLAEALGSLALVWFIVALCAVLLTTSGVWHLARRWVWRPVADLPPSPVQVALRTAIGFAIIVGAALAFAEIAEEVGEEGGVGRFDDALALAIGRNVGSSMLRFFAALTQLGDPLTLTVLCIVVAGMLALRGRGALAFGWVVALAGNGILNGTLKRVFQRVRPLHENALVQAQGLVLITGPTGSGKTTLTRMMLGLLKPTHGDICVDGESVAAIGRAALSRKVQPVFQDPYASLNPRKTIGQIIALPLEIHRGGSRGAM
ncbi:MAG: ATPase, T2SS/T4P/T4SS family, partial [Gammaproteobacteria bacterium]